ncbi:hypothetical protein J6590_091445 [Homalodisca vitripennis]|nr:hypothetical protein J6590_091445 [Homalodisca vitripennis]
MTHTAKIVAKPSSMTGLNDHNNFFFFECVASNLTCKVTTTAPLQPAIQHGATMLLPTAYIQ